MTAMPYMFSAVYRYASTQAQPSRRAPIGRGPLLDDACLWLVFVVKGEVR